MPLPTMVYGAAAALIFVRSWFPWFIMPMTRRASIVLVFWSSAVRESALTAAFNGYGFGRIAGGMRGTGSRDT